MANLPEEALWEPGVYQFEKTDAVEGGPDGIDNRPLKDLANRTLYLKEEVEKRAPTENPALTGTPTAPTPNPGTNTQQIATAAFVEAALAAAVTGIMNAPPATLDTLNELAAALGDDPNFATTVMNQLATKAPLESPALTGTPTAPTAEPGTATQQLASTAFIDAALNLRGVLTGSLHFWPSVVTPSGYLRTNGSVVNRADEPDLWDFVQSSGALTSEAQWLSGDYGLFSSGDGANTFRLPDLRGEFLRVADEGRSLDPGRAFGSLQLDQFQGHWHHVGGNYGYGTNQGPLRNEITERTNDSKTALIDDALDPTNDGVNGAPRSGSETRPRNVAYAFIIKT